VFLHVGLHKSGTTFLQETFKANAAQLRRLGIYYPAGKKDPSLLRAVDDLHGRRQVKADAAQTVGAWSALVGAARGSGASTIVLSDERLSLSGMPAIRAIKRSFEEDDLTVVVTVRDLARTLVSSWEEAVRGGATWAWSEYLAAIRDPDRRGINPARGFWVRQDLAHITAAWEAAVPRDSIVLVTVPPPGAAANDLLSRFAGVFGIDASALPDPPARSNHAIGTAATEMLRRFNLRFGDEFDRREYDRLVKYTIAPHLAQNPVGLPAFDGQARNWLQRTAEEQIHAVRERGYPVVGDLSDLLPAAVDGTDGAGPVDEADVAAAALTALGALAKRQATTSGRTPPGRAAADAGPGRVGSRARSAGFAARRWILARGDRGGIAGILVGRAYRVREWRQDRALRSARRRQPDDTER
jgi:hypothetical protein